MIRIRIHIALLLFLAAFVGSACSHEEVPAGGQISFTFSIEELATRATPGDGNAADGGGIRILTDDSDPEHPVYRPDLVIVLTNSKKEVVCWYPNAGVCSTSFENNSSITKTTISFDSPGKGVYSVYAVANTGWVNTSDSNPLLSTSLDNPASGTQLDANFMTRTGELSFDGGHPMPLSAKGTVSVNSSGNGLVNLVLKRTVARVSLEFENKTGDPLALYGCSITLHKMNPLKGYLFSRDSDYVTRQESDLDDLTLCEDRNIVFVTSKFKLDPKLVFPSIAPMQLEGGRMYLCDISFTIRYPKEDVDYDEGDPDTYTTRIYNNTNLPVQNLSTFENIQALSRNHDLTILTEIHKRDGDHDITFNFWISGWTEREEKVFFH